MLNENEIIETGFAALRSALPKLQPARFVVEVRRQERKAKVQRIVLGLTGCVAIGAVAALGLRPTSALAALTESAKLSSGQPLIHIRFDGRYVPAEPSSPPWPQRPSEDIWKFKDRYIRRLGGLLTEQFRNGTILSYDNRFPFGCRSTYDADKDQFWKFNGTVGIDFQKLYRNPPHVSEIRENGVPMLDYTWQEEDSVGHVKTEHVYVDATTKFIRSSKQVTTSPNGDRSLGTAKVDYPRTDSIPTFPPGLVLKTKEQAVQDFEHRIREPEQSKTVNGVRVTLYGVIAHPNVPDGIGIQVLTTGGIPPDYGSGHQPEALNAKLLPVKRSEWFPGIGDSSHSRFGHFERIGNRTYVMNQSSDLLFKAPTQITLRVPVWRLHPGTSAHDFVGYATFTTSKIFYAVGPDWDYLSNARSSR